MANKTITQAHKEEALAAAAVEREHEVFAYQFNIDNYNLMLASLPQDAWPEDIAQYQNTKLEHVPLVDLERVSLYQWRDRVVRLIVTEKIEQAKTKGVYDALVAQLPAATADTLIQTAATNRANDMAALKAARLAGKA